MPIAGGGALSSEVLARGCVNVALMIKGYDSADLRATIEAL